ncbi:MAG: leucine-rich repeat domain-containing protein, partial [Defluviitaleaceae bacterium]|nr:leucine-rich repeat domain-containing protein [Defluviitaleaceae bacterium]
MKKFLMFALVMVLTLFVLAACGGDNDDTLAAGNDNQVVQGNQMANDSPVNSPEQAAAPLDEPEDNTYGDFVFSVEAGEVTITRYTGSATDLIIPDTINGLPVRIIGASAFFNAAPLTNIVIPDSVTRIERGAFGGHFPITSIVLSNEVVYIGDGAFGYLS